MKLMRILPLGALLFTACATAPKPHAFDDDVIIEADFDQVWGKTIELLMERDIPLSTADKSSGLILTDWMDAGFSEKMGVEFDKIADCGSGGLLESDGSREWKLNVHLKPVGTNKVEVNIRSSGRQARTNEWTSNDYDKDKRWQDCFSTGEVEGRYLRWLSSGFHPDSVSVSSELD